MPIPHTMTMPGLAIRFLGPRLISMFLQCLESGIIIGQSIEYWWDVLDLDSEESRRESENTEVRAGIEVRKETRPRMKSFETRWEVQIMVAFVTIVAL